MNLLKVNIDHYIDCRKITASFFITKVMYLDSPELYADSIKNAISSVKFYSGLREIRKEYALTAIIDALKSCNGCSNKVIFIGNGGSAAIASHMALDFSNAGRIRAVCFNDGPLITCLANDYSYEKVFEKAVEMYADSKDVLIAISSSGESANILNGVKAAKQKKCFVITLSGFQFKNHLMAAGDLNIFIPIPRPNYGPVEISHYMLLHYINDLLKNSA